MSKRNSAPTVGWVFTSTITRWMAWGLAIVLLVTFITIWTVTYSIRRDCSDYYERNIGVFGYWIVVQFGSTDQGCPDLRTDR